MLRFILPLLTFIAVPAQAAPTTADLQIEQTLAVALEVQNQILACWSLPSGYENKLVSVRLAFFGDGTLDGDPSLEPQSLIIARRYPELMRSIAGAIENCLPYTGLEALGAGPGERFDITVHFQS
ncbi:hypothetical protein [Devosia rhizoryzae]|uniref:TonB C-terminal domain-containing protein n=1 Tax=Devosia rhizoryzae TaxID=2774137 RepID=A0ABX7C3T5_9HYPH|nr:hypothetical protein [Devosia rhizoryzae]QQR38895.1 hypothetical protein JI748_14230 [Devosia rhizoryzae]